MCSQWIELPTTWEPASSSPSASRQKLCRQEGAEAQGCNIKYAGYSHFVQYSPAAWELPWGWNVQVAIFSLTKHGLCPSLKLAEPREGVWAGLPCTLRTPRSQDNLLKQTSGCFSGRRLNWQAAAQKQVGTSGVLTHFCKCTASF